MSDTRVTLTWKPALPLGPNLAPYYMVEVAEYPDGDWSEVYEAVRGISCDINGLTPLRDYRFRVSVSHAGLRDYRSKVSLGKSCRTQGIQVQGLGKSTTGFCLRNL